MMNHWKNHKIWDKASNSIKKNDSELVYNKKYIKTKIKSQKVKLFNCFVILFFLYIQK